LKNPEAWRPTKFVYRGNRLRASRDPRMVSIGSRLFVDLTAAQYDRHLKAHAKGRLLDLGCGEVPLYAAYRDLVGDVVCVDWSRSVHDVSHLDQEADLTRPLPFSSASFDTIILSDVLEHIPVPDLLWQEMARLLAPGGRLIMNVPFYYSIHEEPHDYYRYTEYALRRFVAGSGLDLVALEPIGGAPEVLADLTAKAVLSTPVVGRPVSVAIQALAGSLGRTRLGAGLTRRSHRRYPLGYFLVAERPASAAA
jgi:SAM-dependent methyltransferase